MKVKMSKEYYKNMAAQYRKILENERIGYVCYKRNAKALESYNFGMASELLADACVRRMNGIKAIISELERYAK